MWPKRTPRASVQRSIALIALSTLFALASIASAQTTNSKQLGEDRWVPSLELTAGFAIQGEHKGEGSSSIRPIGSPTFTQLREPVSGDDTVVSPFVGWALEIMTPALDLPARPRVFFGAEFMPTFAPKRTVGVQGDPNCVRGPEPNLPCARDEDGTRRRAFSESAANGLGTKVVSRVGTMAYGAHLGLSFPFEYAERQFRIKPSISWINFKVSGSGLVVDAACDPVDICTDVFVPSIIPGFPPGMIDGFLRETILIARDSQRHNAIGPGIDLEMDTGRFGPFGVSLFVGGRAYFILDDREMLFETTQFVTDQIGNDEINGSFKVEIDKMLYRAHIGIRFQFVGMQQ